jgi:hypothetical protein
MPRVVAVRSVLMVPLRLLAQMVLRPRRLVAVLVAVVAEPLSRRPQMVLPVVQAARAAEAAVVAVQA